MNRMIHCALAVLVLAGTSILGAPTAQNPINYKWQPAPAATERPSSQAPRPAPLWFDALPNGHYLR